MLTYLNHSHFVSVLSRSSSPTTECVHQEESSRPHDDEIDRHGDYDSEDVSDVVQYTRSLSSEDHDDTTDQHLLPSLGRIY